MSIDALWLIESSLIDGRSSIGLSRGAGGVG